MKIQFFAVSFRPLVECAELHAMSRLIVKNLPTYITPTRLKDLFAQKGIVTDAKVAQKPDGTSRRFGFVGFKSEKEAQAARDWFDRTFIDSSRISVEVVDVSARILSLFV